MTQMSSVPKLTPENWDQISQTQYHIIFLNERNAIRSVLYDLLKIDNEIKCTNVEIQKLKTNFDSNLCYFENQSNMLQNDSEMDPDERNKLIAENVKKIELVNQEFSEKIEKFQSIKGKNCQAVNENVEKLFELKSDFKATHEKQVESLKRFRLNCNRNLRPQVEVRLKSINRKFCDELFYIDSCEKDLKHIFSLIDDKSSCSAMSSGTCASEESQKYAEFLMDFAWMRNEQISKRSELFEYFKKYVAKDVIAALTAMHIYKPDDPIKFLATFLKQLKQNEFRQKVQRLILEAAQNGDELFTEDKKIICDKNYSQ